MPRKSHVLEMEKESKTVEMMEQLPSLPFQIYEI
jgi:hypothetical protein